MQFNIISNLAEPADPATFYAYNHIIAYHLKKALEQQGHGALLVSDKETVIPQCTNTILISNIAMNKARNNPEYYSKLRHTTSNKLCMWLDSDLGGWANIVDIIFCVNRRCKTHPETFRHVGWAADPNIFYPEQKEPVVYVDPYMHNFYNGRYSHVYDVIKEALASTQSTIIQPVTEYNHGRITWLSNAEYFRKTSFYVLTQPGYWGWTNIEAASCGALLVVHESLDKPDTWPSKLNNKVYSSKEELLTFLKEPVNIQANREVALQNSWSKVTDKVLEAL